MGMGTIRICENLKVLGQTMKIKPHVKTCISSSTQAVKTVNEPFIEIKKSRGHLQSFQPIYVKKRHPRSLYQPRHSRGF